MSASLPLLEDASSGWGARFARRLSRWVARPLFWVVVVSLGMGIPIINRVREGAPQPLPILGTLPSFQLTDQAGRPFGSKDLEGYVWVAGFIFTRCPTICPLITATMGKVQRRARGIENGFRLVSLSVDPGYDTPAVLEAYAQQHKASPRMWKFLTGSFDAVKKTVVDGLKISMGDLPAGTDFAGLFHGTHFVLVDQRGRIRGYYDSSAPDVVDRLLHDGAMLINRGD